MATLLDAVPADERDGVLRALDVLTHSLTSPPTSQDRHMSAERHADAAG